VFFRILGSISTVALGACVASWGALVRYSDRPLAVGEDIVWDAYRAALDDGVVTSWDAIDVRETPSASPPPVGLEQIVPGHWTDSLKTEARAALSSPALVQTGDRLVVLRILDSLGVRTTEGARPESAMTSRVAAFWISRPGFNEDSTIAAVSREFHCGLICGAGEVILLARRPGYRWQSWKRIGLWRS
jgi:hypothetical protein